MPRFLSLLDPPFLARTSGGGGFACADYTPGQATSVYVGFVNIFSQADVDALTGFDGIDGGLSIFDTSVLTDVGPLNAIKEITGNFSFESACLPAAAPMTGLRYVNGSVSFSVNNGISDADNFAFNLTRVTGSVVFGQGAALTSLGTGLMRHLVHASTLIFQLGSSATISLNGLFPCFTGDNVTFQVLDEGT